MVRALETCGRHWGRTTFKREMAMISFAAWLALTFYYFTLRDPALVTAFGPAYSTATTFIFLYIGSAFGMDFYAKQVQPARAPGG